MTSVQRYRAKFWLRVVKSAASLRILADNLRDYALARWYRALDAERQAALAAEGAANPLDQ